jgi:hypothetical protein
LARAGAQLREALGALDIKLSADDLTRIARAVPAEAVAGTRHAEQLMNMLDSERTGASVSWHLIRLWWW